MRKGRDGEMEKMEWKIMAEIVATTSLPVDRLTVTDCNAAARAKKVAINVVASRPPNGGSTRTPTARAKIENECISKYDYGQNKIITHHHPHSCPKMTKGKPSHGIIGPGESIQTGNLLPLMKTQTL